jgi:hypothetical protein
VVALTDVLPLGGTLYSQHFDLRQPRAERLIPDKQLIKPLAAFPLILRDAGVFRIDFRVSSMTVSHSSLSFVASALRVELSVKTCSTSLLYSSLLSDSNPRFPTG